MWPLPLQALITVNEKVNVCQGKINTCIASLQYMHIA